jgi:hypothetical protein
MNPSAGRVPAKSERASAGSARALKNAAAICDRPAAEKYRLDVRPLDAEPLLRVRFVLTASRS